MGTQLTNEMRSYLGIAPRTEEGRQREAALLAEDEARDAGRVRRPTAAGYAAWPEVGYRLRLLRKSKGWSVRDVEKRADISNAYVSQLETGAASEPSLTKLMTLCSLYGVKLDDLLLAA